jgi:RhtB (resistance to homoserine/threonine) family protein
MNIYIYQLLIVAGIHALAVISPGPDFVLVSRLSLSYSRKIGLAGAVGIALGIGVHIAYSILGIGTLIASSVLLFNTIKILGALYLVYIGVISIRQSSREPDENKLENASRDFKKKRSVYLDFSSRESEDMTYIKALRLGFLTNVLNPKATLFILAVFTQVITPATPKFIQLVYGVEMIFATVLWFSIVAFFLSTDYVARKIKRVGGVVDKITGAVLIALGLKILLESQSTGTANLD